MPMPSPNARIAPITESRSLSRRDSTPSSTAAKIDPASAPYPTLTPSSSAAAPPVNASSLVPCTANAILRVTMSGPSTPATSPSTAAAISAVCTKSSSSRSKQRHDAASAVQVVGLLLAGAARRPRGSGRAPAPPRPACGTARTASREFMTSSGVPTRNRPSTRYRTRSTSGSTGLSSCVTKSTAVLGLAPPLVDQLADHPLVREVQRQQRLVAEHHRRIADQRLCDAQPLLLTTGQQADRRVRVPGGAHGLDGRVDPDPAARDGRAGRGPSGGRRGRGRRGRGRAGSWTGRALAAAGCTRWRGCRRPR